MTIIRSGRRTTGHRRSRGQALAEFALVAPIFFLVLFAVIEAGRFMFYYETLNNATREGARYAIVHGVNSFDCTGPPAPGAASACDPSGADVKQRVRDSAFGVFGTAMTITPAWYQSDGVTPGDNGRGQTVTVTAEYTYSSLIPLVPLPAITVKAESSLVVNN
jgi:Flp pilus assembly protein TadG